MKPWDRPGETPKRRHAFSHFRDLGAGRSVKAAQAMHEEDCLGGSQIAVRRRRRPSGQWGRWCREGDWIRRAAAWDAHVDREVQARNAARIVQARERHAQIAAVALGVLTVPIRLAVDAMQGPALKALAQAAKTDPDALARLLDMVARHSYAVQGLVNVERVALNMDTPEVEQADPRQSGLLDAIDTDPELADLAIQLVSRATQAGTSRDDVLTEVLRAEPEYVTALAIAVERETTKETKE